MSEKKYNVYAWHKRKDGTQSPAVRVMTEVSLLDAGIGTDIYQNLGPEWNAYIVEVSNDPGYSK